MAKYSTTEERLNITTHAAGAIAAIPAGWLLIRKAEGPDQVAAWIFGLSLLMLYTASTCYHAAVKDSARARLRIFDHAAIYVLIAGTYTPICLIALKDTWGSTLLWVIWSVAILGVILKLFFTGRYDRASTVLYVAMGWIAVFAIKPLLSALDTGPLLWLLAGGVSYTIGAILYRLRKLPYNHAIFHIFVLGGSGCHYWLIYQFVV